MRRPPWLAIAVLAFVATGSADAEERLVLLGGGDHPREAMLRFVEWAGGAAGRVLVVPWASSDPKGSAKEVVQEVLALRARFRAGVVFGGTSAGTAIMSERMITGNGD